MQGTSTLTALLHEHNLAFEPLWNKRKHRVHNAYVVFDDDIGISSFLYYKRVLLAEFNPWKSELQVHITPAKRCFRIRRAINAFARSCGKPECW